jgi:hypothetical protein
MPTFIPPAPEFGGLYAYAIQGFMHAQSIDDQDYIIGLRDANQNPQPLRVNRGGATLNKTSPNDPDPGRSRAAVEMPVLTAFYSLNYPSAQFSQPPPAAPPHPPPPNPPAPAGFFPVNNSPPYTPNVGYYPFSETGFMIFFPGQTLSGGNTGTIVSDGFVRGRTRVNTAGYGGSGAGADFQGSYKFDRTPLLALPTGVITIQLDTLANHVWDYAFTRVSRHELLLTAIGRVPRPGVGTGTMRRIEDQRLLVF